MELHQEALSAAAEEKRTTLYLLECLHWVEARKVHLERGYASLFAYVCGALGYSESQASERIRAMRLMHEVPEVHKGLADGSLTLTSVARVASHARRENLEPAQVAKLLPQIENLSVQRIDRLLASLAPEPTRVEKLKPINDRQTELRVTLDAETLELLEQARELDANPGVEVAEVLKRSLRQYVKAKRTQKACELKNPEQITPARRSTAVTKRTRAIPRPLRREVWKRAGGRCEYRDPETGKLCDATHALTFEHRTPFALGGSHTRENLALFCAAHNTHAGEKVFGRWRG